MNEKRRLIICNACGEDAFLVKKPVYKDFKKLPDQLSCASCGHKFNDIAEVVFKEKEKFSLFDEEIEAKPEIFTEKTDIRNCRRCRHYIVNPFAQRCGLHLTEVKATDICEDFEVRLPPDENESDKIEG